LKSSNKKYTYEQIEVQSISGKILPEAQDNQFILNTFEQPFWLALLPLPGKHFTETCHLACP
jgi:hypothetical protein